MSKKIFIPITIIILLNIPAYAQSLHSKGISLDGSIGSAGKLELQGPDFDIKAEYGKQSGTNLFHSFEKFNLHSGESATFSGPDTVNNIISRVTGGESSWIDGAIKSTIPDANFYFLNPSGVMFGPNSSLDIGGSFHVSTANYLKLGENETFYSDIFSTSELTSSSPTAFGFLTDQISSITIDGKGEIFINNSDDLPTTGLVVKNGKTLSLIGGEINIKNETFVKIKDTIYDYEGQPHEYDVSRKLGTLTAPQGEINLISFVSKGEVNIFDTEVDLSLLNQYGNITISDKSLLDVSGEGAGSIFMCGKNILIRDSAIQADTYGRDNGGMVNISAENISFLDGSRISLITYGSGSGCALNINALKDILFSVDKENHEHPGNYIFSQNKEEMSYFQNVPLPNFSGGIVSISASIANNGGNSGNISIYGENIFLSNGARIIGSTYGDGKGSDIKVIALETINFFGSNFNNDFSGIIIETHSKDLNAGCAGNIMINANNIILNNGAGIEGFTFGHGNSGSIKMYAKNKISFIGNSKDLYVLLLLKMMKYFGEGNEEFFGGGVFVGKCSF